MSDHWFGLRAPKGSTPVAAEYGCRAILHSRGRKHQTIDVVPDRRSAQPSPLPDEFKDWLNAVLGLWLRNSCGQSWIDPTSSEEFWLDDGRFHAIASPRGSHGYLYVGAWMDAE